MSAKVAGTIMYKTKQGQYDFLVQPQADDSYKMLVTNKDSDQTPLAAVLIALQTQLKINVNELRLINLANINLEGENVSFFVFQWSEHQADFYTEQLRIISEAGFRFAKPSEFTQLLDKLEVTSVPHLN
ncbi:hypothetical protein [Latilactobacillus graminis]|uniref:Uncharacterized protein n=2 Tax=Latilactobacillus graminis TaxID=60519 RepID=A0AA89KYJ0_9LACO|nr:hypothetical protein [Latilactobacillus graminis]KRM24445.1 hypothetical protein FC90_GL000586 [Latilactobacillus graminis DSM 20719]QFP80006.1 hypothetical protein LG542_07190 [Latilactobacillus graminis]